MSDGRLVLLIAACAVVTAVIRGVGPLALGGRALPGPLAAVVPLLAAPLLAGLVVTQALVSGDHLLFGANVAGVAAAGLAGWRGASVLVCVVLAALVTAGLRLLL